MQILKQKRSYIKQNLYCMANGDQLLSIKRAVSRH